MVRRRADMTVEEAADVLCVETNASADELRTAFRAQLRAHHPDRNGAADAGRRTALVIAAYRTLRRAPSRRPLQSSTRAGPTPAPPSEIDALVTMLPPCPDPFFALLEAAHVLGDVTYASRSDGLIEAIVPDAVGTACSVLLRLDDEMVTVCADDLTAERHLDPAPYATRLAELLAR